MSRNQPGRVFYAGLLQALTQILGAAKGYLGDHGPRVALLASKIGDRMGLPPRDSSGLFIAAILSDVGMIGLAEEAWEDPVVELPADVWRRVRRHPARSEARVRLIPHLETLGPLIRHHHEWWDGSGYPDGLSERAIPLGARIIRMADTVTALSAPRPYRLALTPDEILHTVAKGVGLEFAPDVARTYMGLHRTGFTPRFDPYTFHLAVDQAVRDVLPKDVSPLSNSQLLTILANLVDAKDPYTAGHSRRVAMLATAVGSHLGFRGHTRSVLWAVGYLHDLGKLKVPIRILAKEGGLSEEERALVEAHPGDGADILQRIASLRHLAPGARYHHERWDGEGYPEGKTGDDIPLVAQIISVCDAYDAMTSKRAFRDSWSHEEALAEIEACSGTWYAPRVVEAFLQLPASLFDAVRAEYQASRNPSLVELPLFPSPELESPLRISEAG
jgi:HD-GYP domain-containing protein (c-di-GMP phosphodiesterase class II)